MPWVTIAPLGVLSYGGSCCRGETKAIVSVAWRANCANYDRVYGNISLVIDPRK